MFYEKAKMLVSKNRLGNIGEIVSIPKCRIEILVKNGTIELLNNLPEVTEDEHVNEG